MDCGQEQREAKLRLRRVTASLSCHPFTGTHNHCCHLPHHQRTERYIIVGLPFDQCHISAPPLKRGNLFPFCFIAGHQLIGECWGAKGSPLYIYWKLSTPFAFLAGYHPSHQISFFLLFVPHSSDFPLIFSHIVPAP